MKDLVASILDSRKYRALGVPEATLRKLVEQEAARGFSGKDLEQAVREKLHNIVAPYLGDPDYGASASRLDQAFQGGTEQVKAACIDLLQAHASTRERLPALDEFYQQLFLVTGIPEVVLDLACGLHPFGLPWMGLSSSARYYAYDLHRPRIELINHFFALSGLPRLAFHQDVLLEPPAVKADVAFFFKEAHRFEQRERGCNRAFWLAVQAHWLLVSLPANNLTGRRDLAERQRTLVSHTLSGLDWPVQEIRILDELVFLIDKGL